MNWLHFFDLSSLSDFIFAQAPTPSPQASPPPEVDLLKSQLEFLKYTNTAFLTFLLFVGGLLTWFFNKSLEDAKRLANQIVRQEVESQIATQVKDTVSAEIETVKRTLLRERVIGSTLVDYYLPKVASTNKDKDPREFLLLKTRNFANIRLISKIEELKDSPGDVVVLDLENWEVFPRQFFPQLPEDEREKLAQQQIDAVLKLDALPRSLVLVVYIRLTVKYLYSVPKNRYVLAANSPVALVGTIADAAYVSSGEETIRRSERSGEASNRSV